MATQRAVAAPGGKTTEITRAPPAIEHKSKRFDRIISDGDELDRNLLSLHQQTIQKNREFQRRINALAERRRRWQGELQGEVEQRQIDHDALKSNFTTQLEDLSNDFESYLNATFDRIQTKTFPPIENRLTNLNDSLRHFVDVTVPEVIDAQSGAVTRSLVKSRETFEIDNTKLLKREERIVSRREAHVSHSAELFVEEERARRRQQLKLEEEVMAGQQRDDRAEELLLARVMADLAALRGGIEQEAARRQQRDMGVLSTLERAMARVQQSILDNFGAKAAAIAAAGGGGGNRRGSSMPSADGRSGGGGSQRRVKRRGSRSRGSATGGGGGGRPPSGRSRSGRTAGDRSRRQ